MQFTLLQHWEDINHNHGIKVTVQDGLWNIWYKQMMWRYELVSKYPGYKDWIRTFDVDECQELRVIWIEHLAELLKFLANNK